MDSHESDRMSVLLSKYMDYTLGTAEVVDTSRWLISMLECIENYGNNVHKHNYIAGSKAEGLNMQGSDFDLMHIDKDVVVTYPGQPIPPDYIHKAVLYMTEADHCRPGYVNLQTVRGHSYAKDLCDAFILVENLTYPYVSSDIYREVWVNISSSTTGMVGLSNGPSSTFSLKETDIDFVPALHCINWPRQANEWITRTRLYGWPAQTLIDKIVRGGCHVVPVGDKCSDDTLLQWRISLVGAERHLVHSFDHVQFKTYGLLKYLLKQIKPCLLDEVGDDDILCSYFLKTAMFTAIENTHKTFWQEKNIFYCFWFCFNMLIAWVKAGYCPNYFIPTNNMLLRKVHGLNQLKLLQILQNIHQLKWKCLSIGTIFIPIWEILCDPLIQLKLMDPTAMHLEMQHDKSSHASSINRHALPAVLLKIHKALHLLSKSESDNEECLAYILVVSILSSLAGTDFPEHSVATDNKTRYKILRKYKRWLSPMASIGTDILHMATFHFKTGNYGKSLEMCVSVLLSNLYYMGNTNWSPYQNCVYMQNCCGRGYSLMYKMKNIFAYATVNLRMDWLSLPHLHPEISKNISDEEVKIPPFPYAVFLAFLCFHDIGDTRRRAAALHHLLKWKDDEQQGSRAFWIVHTLLGICYQTMGDNRRAIRSYWDSWQADSQWNPALERIAVVYLVMCYQKLSAQ